MELSVIIISLLAISLSLYTIFYYHLKIKSIYIKVKNMMEQETDDQRIIALKAKVRAHYTQVTPGSYVIEVFNVGPGIARNVNIQFNPKAYNDLVNLDHFPCNSLNPQDSKEIYMNLHNGLPNTLAIKLQWDDEFDFNNEHMQVITL